MHFHCIERFIQSLSNLYLSLPCVLLTAPLHESALIKPGDQLPGEGRLCMRAKQYLWALPVLTLCCIVSLGGFAQDLSSAEIFGMKMIWHSSSSAKLRIRHLQDQDCRSLPYNTGT